MKKIEVGIIGIGMVGAPLRRWLIERRGYKWGVDLFCFDKHKTSYFDSMRKAKIVFICVPTPQKKDGSCDVSIVESVVKQFAGSDKIIVLKSTVPPGTCDWLSRKYKINFFLFNPEYLTEAQAWQDFCRPDRQIVGPVNEDSHQFAGIILDLLPPAFFRSPGVLDTYDFHAANSTEAELGKYAGNIFGAVKVTFGNVFCDVCEALGTNYENVRKILSYDSRIGGSWLDVKHGAYRGFGGFCFPKDLSAFLAFADIVVNTLKEGQLKRRLVKGLDILKAIWEYNRYLLQTQGLSIKDVSEHDSDLKEKLEKKGETINNV